jgi:hypothetical protein
LPARHEQAEGAHRHIVRRRAHQLQRSVPFQKSEIRLRVERRGLSE